MRQNKIIRFSMNATTATMSDTQTIAVAICHGFKSYHGGSKTGTVEVLRRFSMCVPTGHLYSLVGSSGCGKTTVLSLLTGINKLDLGTLSVFGCNNVPLSPNRWQQIGYMPQEISLYNRYSIKETLIFFSQLFDTNKSHSKLEYVLDRIAFLRELLSLPEVSRIVGTLSGGQKRRVSLAAALINEPELLLLDEPTVGIDPLMRQSIWQHLKYLTSHKNTTIILTTHYIDEAKDSDIVGMMRNGCLIAEDNPTKILNHFNVQSLEAAYLKLSVEQENGMISLAPSQPNMLIHNKCGQNQAYNPLQQLRCSVRRIEAFTKKNFRVLVRSPWMTFFLVIWPLVFILIDNFALSDDLRDLGLGVVNKEVPNEKDCWRMAAFNTNCHTQYLSCNFLQELPPDRINLKAFNKTADAVEATQRGVIWGFITFSENYSESLKRRAFSGDALQEDEAELDSFWNSSIIYAQLDQSNMPVYIHILTLLYEAYESSAKQSLRNCNLDERNAEFSLKFLDPIEGKDVTLFSYYAPGFLAAIIFAFTSLASVRVVAEKKAGTMERCLAAGAQLWEILVSYFLPEMVILLAQIVICYGVLSYILSVGPSFHKAPDTVLLAVSFLLLQGTLGILCGLVLGVLCNDEMAISLILLAIQLPVSLTSGVYWPIEGMPETMKFIAKASPLTASIEALGSIINRDWGLTHPHVWPGFVIVIGYILLTVALLACILRFKQRK